MEERKSPARTFRLHAATLLVVGLLPACARPRDGAGTAVDAGGGGAAASSPIGSSAGGSPLAASAPAAQPAPYGLALADRLGLEAAGRPTDTPKAEDALAAVAKAGVPLQDQAQHLASPVGARFCIGAKSPRNLAMSACEYTDAAAAAAGRDMSAKAFASVEHRDIIVNKKTTLTILQSPFDAQSQAAHDRAVAAFKAM